MISDQPIDIESFVRNNPPNYSGDFDSFQRQVNSDWNENDYKRLTVKIFYRDNTPCGWYDYQSKMGFITPPNKETSMNEIDSLKTLSGITSPVNVTPSAISEPVKTTSIQMSGPADEIAKLLQAFGTDSTDAECPCADDEDELSGEFQVADENAPPRSDNRPYNNSPHEQTRDYDPNDFVNIINKVRDLDVRVSPRKGDNPIRRESDESTSISDTIDPLEQKLTETLMAELESIWESAGRDYYNRHVSLAGTGKKGNIVRRPETEEQRIEREKREAIRGFVKYSLELDDIKDKLAIEQDPHERSLLRQAMDVVSRKREYHYKKDLFDQKIATMILAAARRGTKVPQD